MPTRLQLRRGNTSVSNALTGLEGELFVDTETKSLVLHDGVVAGGYRLTSSGSPAVDSLQNTNITIASSYANSAFLKANIANTLAQSAYDYANTITISTTPGSYANSAYNQANTGTILAQASFDYANTITVSSAPGSYANSAYNQANTGTILAQAAFDYANTIVSDTQVDPFARTQANTANSHSISSFNQANTATTNAATADQRAVTSGSYANSAYSQSNTATTNAATADQRAVTSGSYANSAYAAANTAAATIPQNAISINYTLVSTDAGKHIYSTNSTSQIITISNNGNVSWNVGSTIMLIIQGTGTMNVVPQTGVTMYMANSSTSKSYANVSSYGMATLLNVGANTWFINGAGVS